MAWTSVGQIGSTVTFPAGTKHSTGLDASVTAGSVLVMIVATDNATSASASTTQITSVTDAGGNTWVKAAEFTNPTTTGGGGSKAGVTVAAFYSKITTTLVNGAGAITATFSVSIAAAASSVWQFQVNAGSTLSFMGATAQKSNSYGPLTLSSFTSNEYLFFMGGALEFESFGFTNTANYTPIGANFADGGGTASSCTVNGEFRILTGTGDISDPTEATAADCASVFFAIKEQLVVGGSQLLTACMTGVGQ